MTYSRWHAYIGLSQISFIMLDADLHHSDGQKRSVYIYRFLTAGTIDGEFLSTFRANCVANMPYAEKIYQRQITKLGLSSSTLLFLST
jgi:DNA repair and recombination protein RAD54B